MGERKKFPVYAMTGLLRRVTTTKPALSADCALIQASWPGSRHSSRLTF